MTGEQQGDRIAATSSAPWAAPRRVAVAAVASPIAATEAEAYDPGADETRARYRETRPRKAFYRTNGYETLKK